MKNKKKKRKALKIIASVLSVIILSIGILTVILFYPAIISNKKIVYNYFLGNIVRTRVANAQYLPTNVLSKDNINMASYSKELDHAPQMLYDDYNNLIDSFGDIITDDMGGMENALLHINTIKDEIYNIITKAPAFDVWFAEGAGLNNWFPGNKYYIHYDQEKESISITCLSIKTDTAIYDYDKDKVKHSYYFGPILQQIMEIKYFYNDEGKEVVELYSYATLIDGNNYYPISYQYMKNVRDSSFTKIYILSDPRIRTSESYRSKAGPNCAPGAHDIKNANKYGTARVFIQLDYSDAEDVSLMLAEQFIPDKCFNLPKTTFVRMYDKKNNNVVYSDTAYNYAEEYEKEFLSLQGPKENILSAFDSYYYTRFTNYPREYVDNAISRNVDISKTYESSEKVINKKQTYYINSSYSDLHKTQDRIVSRLAINSGLEQCYINDYLLNNDDYTTNYKYEEEFDKFLDQISIRLIDNYSIKNNIKKIYKESKRAAIIDERDTVSFTTNYIETINNENSCVINDGIIDYSIKGEVSSSILLNRGAEYSLSLILIDGNYSYTLATKYQQFTGEKMAFEYQGSYDLGDLVIELKGNYKLAVALTYKRQTSDIVYSRIEPINTQYDSSYQKSDTLTDYHTYYELYFDEEFFIRAHVIDVTAPVIKQNDDNDFVYSKKIRAGEILGSFDITDNEVVVSIEIYDIYNQKISLYSYINSGSYTIVAQDSSGNIATHTVNVVIPN